MPGLHIDKVGGGDLNNPKNFVYSNYEDLMVLAAKNELKPGNKYVMSYLHKYTIAGSNSSGLIRNAEIFTYQYGYATFGYYIDDMPVGTEVFVTYLPEGYEGSIKVGDKTTVTVNSQEWYFKFANGMHTIVGLGFKYFLTRYTTIAENAEIFDANGKPVMRPEGIINTEVYDGTAYMNMTAEENFPILPEEILLTAKDTGSFEREAESLTYPGDIVTYRPDLINIYNDNYELVGTRPGFITARKNDSLAIDVGMCWRNAKFRRWQLNLDSRTKLLNQHLDIDTTKLGYQGKWLYTAGKRKVTEPEYFYVAKDPEGKLPNLNENAQWTEFDYTVEDLTAAKDYPIFPLNEERNPHSAKVIVVKIDNISNTVFQQLSSESNFALIAEFSSVHGSTFVGSTSLADIEGSISNHIGIDSLRLQGYSIQFKQTVNLSFTDINRCIQTDCNKVIWATMQNGVRLDGVDQPLPVVWWIYMFLDNTVFNSVVFSGITPQFYLSNCRLIETSLFAYYSPTHPSVLNDSEYMREQFSILGGVFSKVTMRFLNVVDRVVLSNMLFKDSNPNTATGLSMYDFTNPMYSKVLELNAETWEVYYRAGGNLISATSDGGSTQEVIYTGIIRIKDQVLTPLGWVLNEVTGLYEYIYENANITLSKEVEIVPQNDSLEAVIAAGISPFIKIAEGSVTIFAETAPNAEITVNILIQEAKDV